MDVLSFTRTNARHFILIAAVFFSVADICRAQSAQDFLKRENARLRAEIDSLNRVINSFNDDPFSTWDSLTGIEEDDDITSIFFGYSSTGLSGSHAELMERIRSAAPSVASSWNDAIEQKISVYTGSRRRSMPSILGRYNLFLPLFRSTFAKYGVPEELIALCIVESAVSRRALSHAGAAGLWQIMPETGRQYGLRIDRFIDERYDPEKATDAAARILRDLRKSLGRWDLAILAYNCGAGRVRRAIMASSASSDIWDIMSTLPGETRSYLPSYLAARYIVVEKENLGITVNRQKGFPKTRTAVPDRETTFKELSQKTHIKETLLRELNPKIIGDIIPGGVTIEIIVQ